MPNQLLPKQLVTQAQRGRTRALGLIARFGCIVFIHVEPVIFFGNERLSCHLGELRYLHATQDTFNRPTNLYSSGRRRTMGAVKMPPRLLEMNQPFEKHLISSFNTPPPFVQTASSRNSLLASRRSCISEQQAAAAAQRRHTPSCCRCRGAHW